MRQTSFFSPGDTRLPATFKPHASSLVTWWMTTCESLLLYVLLFFLCFDFFFNSFYVNESLQVMLLLNMLGLYRRIKTLTSAIFSAFKHPGLAWQGCTN